MKKILIACCFSIICLNTIQAQKLRSSQVPVNVRNAFSKAYPSIKAKWEKENKQFEAGFKQNGKLMSVVYTSDGTLVEIETAIKVSQLPGSVVAYLKKNKPGKSIHDAAKIITADGVVTYEAEVQGKDLIFDKDGNFIKEQND